MDFFAAQKLQKVWSGDGLKLFVGQFDVWKAESDVWTQPYRRFHNFTALEIVNWSTLYVLWKCQSMDFEAQKLWKGRSGN